MRKDAVALCMAMMTAAAWPATGYAKNEKSSNGQAAQAAKAEASETAAPESEPEAIIKFSDEQILLNNQAVDAGNAGDYKKAEQLFMAMLHSGEMNIIWGNLGGVYAKQGKCIEAKDAFERVWTSPKISEIPSEAIEQSAAQALENLKTQCNAQVVVKCSPADMTLQFDDGNAYPCTALPISLTPGKHRVLGKTSYGFNSIEIEASADELRTYSLEVLNYERIASDAGVSPEQLAKRSKTFKSVGYSFLGVGALIGAGGGVLMWLADRQNHDKYVAYEEKPNKETFDRAQDQYGKSQTELYASYGLMGLGGAMIVTGIVLAIYDAVKIQPQISEFERGASAFSWQFSPAVSPGYSGFAFSAQF